MSRTWTRGVRKRSRPHPARLLLPIALLLAACTGDASPSLPLQTLPPGTSLEAGSTEPLVFEAGSSAPEPIRVRVTAAGQPVVGVRVSFTLPSELGRMSQPLAQTDAEGWAESWVLEARPGEGVVRAALGEAEAERPLRILTAPGSISIETSTAAPGRPGFVPPDPIVRARVLDTEGAPLAGQPVVFAWAGQLAVASDTSDAEGRVEGRLGASPLGAGDWPVFALVVGRPLAAVDRRITEPVARRVVVVAIDGLGADAVGAATTPALHSLAAEGARVSEARSLEPTFSVPANLSMLAGEGPASHRLFSEALDFTPEMNRLDPLFRIGLRRGRGTTAVLSQLGHLARFDEILECRLAFGFDPLVTVSGGSESVVDAALPLLDAEGPEMLFVHLPDVDLAGHEHGWSSAEYRTAVAANDTQLARLADALPDDALLVVVAAHGGGGSLGDFQHGSTEDADIRIPIILHGAGVAPGSVLPEAGLLDIAPTLGWALGWASPSRWTGTPLLDAFGGTRPGQSGRTEP